MFERYAFLGGRAYYCPDGNSHACRKSFRETLGGMRESVVALDAASVYSILEKNYIIGDRTICQGIDRTPWMSQPDGAGGWQYAELPMHGEMRLSEQEISETLEELLCGEAMEFLEGKNSVGLLLSGGMDSRVVAGVLRKLQLRDDYTGSICAITWGVAGSRDLSYAQRIAKEFGWDHVGIPLGPELLRENIHFAAERGAEVSPIHLHGLSELGNIRGLDGVLAGSYGDSIGRGEYSGRHIRKLPRIIDHGLNHFAFLKEEASTRGKVEILADWQAGRRRFKGRAEMQLREIDLQMHYMRRQLNTCMEIVDDMVPFYQMFGHPKVFGFMWSLRPECRSDGIYSELLASLPGRLLELPWARTGRAYMGISGPSDELSQHTARYGEWLRNDCRDLVLEWLNSGVLQRLGIFNDRALEHWTRHWPSSVGVGADRLDERMAWLTSLAICIHKYDIKPPQPPVSASFKDAGNLVKARAYTSAYKLARRILGRS